MPIVFSSVWDTLKNLSGKSCEQQNAAFMFVLFVDFFLPHEDFTHKTAGILQILLQNVILPPPLFLKEMIN